MTLSSIQQVILQKAAVEEGLDKDWLCFASLGAPARIRLSIIGSDYIVATDHNAAAADLTPRWKKFDDTMAGGFTAFRVSGTEALHVLVGDIWRLACALPQAPLRTFETETQDLPRSTEAERIVVQRVGQDIFRKALLAYWAGACAVTGITEPRLLRASHIKPWADCDTDAERLDVFNGLLLAAHLDAAFDAGLISFADDGTIILSPRFAQADRDGVSIQETLTLTQVPAACRPRLAWHRTNIFLGL